MSFLLLLATLSIISIAVIIIVIIVLISFEVASAASHAALVVGLPPEKAQEIFALLFWNLECEYEGGRAVLLGCCKGSSMEGAVWSSHLMYYIIL